MDTCGMLLVRVSEVTARCFAGLRRINSSIPDSDGVKATIIWSMTALATLSVISGVRTGIRRISELNWLLAQFIAFVYFFQGNTWYLLNLLVQSCGYYVQWLVMLGSWTNAFENAPAGPPCPPVIFRVQ
jgi:choline-glycine betaine transporter